MYANTCLSSAFPAYQWRLGRSVHLALEGDSVPVATPQISKLPRHHRQSEHVPVNRTLLFLLNRVSYFFFFSFHRFSKYTRLPVRDPIWFLHFPLLALAWNRETIIDFRRKRDRTCTNPLTFRVDLQRNHGFGLPMAVPRYYGIRAREVEFRVRYFQTVVRSFADQPEVGCVLVVIGLKNEN